jgi:anti-sigma factor RsiW
MSHQPFESWLFSEETLTVDQEKALREHLRTCVTCYRLEATWSQLQRTLHEAPVVRPAQGFVQRWQERLTEYRLQRQRKQAWIIFTILALTALLFFLLLCIQAMDALRSVDQILAIWTVRLVYLVALVGEAQEMIEVIVSVAKSLVPLPVLAVLFWISGGLCMIWFVVYQRFTAQRRVKA